MKFRWVGYFTTEACAAVQPHRGPVPVTPDACNQPAAAVLIVVVQNLASSKGARVVPREIFFNAIFLLLNLNISIPY